MSSPCPAVSAVAFCTWSIKTSSVIPPLMKDLNTDMAAGEVDFIASRCAFTFGTIFSTDCASIRFLATVPNIPSSESRSAIALSPSSLIFSSNFFFSSFPAARLASISARIPIFSSASIASSKLRVLFLSRSYPEAANISNTPLETLGIPTGRDSAQTSCTDLDVFTTHSSTMDTRFSTL